jgi:hypothetical protein
MKLTFKMGLLATTLFSAMTVNGNPNSDVSFASCDSGICTISGTIDQDYTMVAGTNYILSGTVKVGDGNVVISSASEMSAIQSAGVTLTIEPGVNVKADSDGILLVTRGSKLVADGTASAPITFSSLDADYDGMGEWGGIVVQGFAPQYGAGNTGACFNAGEAWCNVQGEGGTTIANYGGNLPADNSGVIRYVRIAEGGLVAGPNNEVNGLTLQGVGHGTQLSHIQVHGNLDDGIEWFGGTANVTHAVLTNNDDDDIDFDEGFQGNIQYALVIKRQDEGATPVGSNDPRGLELNSSDDDYVPQTAGSVANVTVIGGDAANSASEFGMRIRGSVTANIYNSAVAGYDNTCARIDDSDHDGNSATAKIDTPATFTNFICDTAGTPFLKEDPAVGSTGIVIEGINFDANLAITNASASVAPTTITAVNNGSGFVFDSTDYVGAVKAGETPWYEGWTLPGTVSAPSVNNYDFASCDSGICTISGTIDQDYTMVAGTNYILSGTVKVGDGNVVISSASEMSAIQSAGVTLTIEPGVNVKADSDGILLVTRGSKLVADGTASAPITFSSLDADYDGMGEWGGIVVQGFAPQYGAGNTGACFNAGEAWCNVQGEGGTTIANYGGNLPADNSGVIRYVRIAEGGLVAGPNNEVNGLTLQGVGHGTQLSHIQVHGNLDDGIEWFGGTANVTHAVLTNNDDDDIDFDEGFQGNIQYALVIKRQDEGATPVGSNDPRGLELNSSDDDYVPQTAGSVANVTVIGGDAANSASEFGMRIRGSVTANIYNSAVAGYDNTCARIDDSDHDGNSATAKIDTPATFTNFICDTAGTPFLKEDPAVGSTGIVIEGINFDANLAITNASASVAPTTITAVNNGSGFVFDSTDYVGAVKAGETPWYEGWTLPGTVEISFTTTGLVDSDNDGVNDDADAFPNDPSETVDSDNDGVGDNADAFPNDASETADSDNDGVGDNEDYAPNDPAVQEGPKQSVFVDGTPSAMIDSAVSITVGYDVSDDDSSLTGLGLRVHYDSSVLTFVELSDVFATDNISSGGPENDTDDFDNDSSTDKYLTANWASLFGNWPGSLPTELVTATFTVADDDTLDSTVINFSAASNAAGYQFESTPYNMEIIIGSFDFDGNGVTDALTDGLMLLRYTFGLSGSAVTDGAIAGDSPLTPDEVLEALETASDSFADIDGNGDVDALTDGLMLLRYLFGLSGDSVTNGAVAADATRGSSTDIEAYINSMIP